jgi:hypothetical protein
MAEDAEHAQEGALAALGTLCGLGQGTEKAALDVSDGYHASSGFA